MAVAALSQLKIGALEHPRNRRKVDELLERAAKETIIAFVVSSKAALGRRERKGTRRGKEEEEENVYHSSVSSSIDNRNQSAR